ncbi:MAG: acylphosphatase [Treponema sp.]|jgi:acylphosphatase|nr:acylphosphatase [Treponema sp.]
MENSVIRKTGKAVPAALHVLISGRVQGVGFRYSCYAQARRLGLGGWVRNTPEGDVEVWLESPAGELLETMLAWLHRGPPYARVDHIQYNSVRPTGDCQKFSIEP